MHKTFPTAAFVSRSFALIAVQHPEPTPGRCFAEDCVTGYPPRARLFLSAAQCRNLARGGEMRGAGMHSGLRRTVGKKVRKGE